VQRLTSFPQHLEPALEARATRRISMSKALPALSIVSLLVASMASPVLAATGPVAANAQSSALVQPLHKKTTGEDDDEFDFDDEDEPDMEDEFGFDFEFEGQEEPDDPIETFDFEPLDDPDDDPLGELDGIPEKEPTPEPSHAPTGSASATPPGIQLDVVGKSPLGDNYEPAIVAYDRDSVVVELPVLLGRSRADFDGISYCIVAEVFADGSKVAEARQQVTSASLAEFGPSFAFIKMLAPVTAKSGKLEVRLSKASNMSAQPTQLFSRTVSYQLP
jgi:hypothetical protein